jgi:hypothetical protein
MSAVSWWRVIALATPVAVLNEAAGWRDIEPDAVAAVVYVGCGLSLLALGALAGWRGVAAFVPGFLIAGAVELRWSYEQPTYECDPFCASPLALWMVVLPAHLLLVAAGLGGRRLSEHFSRRRTGKA